MKVYRVRRRYGKYIIYECCFADSVEDVYSVLEWKRTDKPKLEIEEVVPSRGCFLSVMTKEVP